jgi:hypothetical protein
MVLADSWKSEGESLEGNGGYLWEKEMDIAVAIWL